MTLYLFGCIIVGAFMLLIAGADDRRGRIDNDGRIQDDETEKRVRSRAERINEQQEAPGAPESKKRFAVIGEASK